MLFRSQRRTETIAKGYNEWVMPGTRYSAKDDPSIRRGKARLSTFTNTRVPAARHVVKITHTKTTEEYTEARKQYNIRSTLDAFIRVRDELGVDILKKVRRLIKEPTRATKVWAGLLLQRVAPGHDMIA